MSLQIYPNYAWIEYLDGTNEARKVRQTIENNDETYTCAVTLAEVVSKIARMGKDPKTAYDILLSNSQLVSVDEEFSLQAGLLQVEMRKTEKDFGLADAYILAAARNIKAKIITGDPHFKSIEDAIMIK